LYLPLAGGTMTNNASHIDMNGSKVTNSGTPSAGGDLCNRTYVDNGDTSTLASAATSAASLYLPLAGTSSLAGSIIPTTTESVDLGSSSKNFANVYATNLTGTLQTPAQTNVTSVGTLTGLAVSTFGTFGANAMGKVGQNGTTDMMIAQTTKFSSASAALRQNDDGGTFLNAANGQTIFFRHNGGASPSLMTMTSATMTVNIALTLASVVTLNSAADIIPATTNLVDLGADLKRFDNIYVNNPVWEASDERLKRNITDVNETSAISVIKDLRVITFQWKESERLSYMEYSPETFTPLEMKEHCLDFENLTEDDKIQKLVELDEINTKRCCEIEEQNTQHQEYVTKYNEKMDQRNAKKTKSEQHIHVGLSAQNTKSVLEKAGVNWQIVHTPDDPDGTLSMAYQSFIPLLIKTNQNLLNRVTQLEAENSKMKTALRQLFPAVAAFADV
jgi:hypothetical protein